MNQLIPAYFATLDSFIEILIDHHIVPLYAPFAHGYGWKGRRSIGAQLVPEEYERYFKYLLARYGSSPAFWLLSLDNNGQTPGVQECGEISERWDAYRQPVGLHYNPHDQTLAGWANGDSSCCFHHNRAFQDANWLDFQWAQTGHDGLHIYRKVEEMYAAIPTKANMEGEPTYEGMGEGKLGLGWWQGENAWNQMMHGGTMGAVYGAACLWQWKITTDEGGWEPWTNAPLSWKEALHLEGSRYVGNISKAFDGYAFADMEKRGDLVKNHQPLLACPDRFYVSFLPKGGKIRFRKLQAGLPYRWFDPESGIDVEIGITTENENFKAPAKKPFVLIIGEKLYRTD
ncbi:MAG: DUF4038 domain-containing protein [Saprospiraceae bacterium]|nr:DUF4038 domain-containing protein [Saprospiraceae bacterium]